MSKYNQNVCPNDNGNDRFFIVEIIMVLCRPDLRYIKLCVELEREHAD